MSPLDASSALVRAWTRLYTWRLPTGTRDVRRAEIDSDLWEFSREHHGRSVLPALHVMVRLLLGMADDVSWRASHRSMRPARLQAVISLAVMLLFAAGVWVYSATQTTELPTPAPLVRIVNVFPPPPPPPPPPGAPR
jgi:hypothetical protein